MVSKREMLINGRLYEVVDVKQYVDHKDAYLNGYVAVDTGSPYIYPVIPSTSQCPGIYIRPGTPFSYARDPEEEDADQYKREHIIDYGDASSFKDFIDKQTMVKQIENDILSTPDNIFSPTIHQEDSPAMKALKEAVVSKHMELDKYEHRFGAN